MNSDGSQTKRVFDPMFNLYFSPDGKRVVYTKLLKEKDQASAELFVAEADGSHPVRLTNNAVFDTDLAWSPDGKRIAFVSFVREGAINTPEIHTVNIDGSHLTRLTHHAAYDGHPNWSPDGTRLVFASTRDCQAGKSALFIINADGSNVARLTEEVQLIGRADWSPDGRKILYTSEHTGNAEIYAINADPYHTINLTNHLAEDQAPVWSPDGKKLAFISNREGKNYLFVMDADGSGQHKILSQVIEYFSWSPDSQHIVFGADWKGNWDVYVANADGSDPRQLTHEPSNEGEPRWSPDGSRIAFVKDEGQVSQLYVMSADGSGVQKLSRSQEHEYQHVWSPDSQKIVFTRSRNRSVPRDLWMMNADGSHLTLIAAAPAEDEFILPAFAPDGQRLVFTRVAMPAHHWTLWTINLNGSGLSQLTFDPSGTAAWSPDGRKIAFMSRRRTGNAEIYLMNLLPFQAPPLVVAAQPTANEAVLRLCANGRKFWNQRTMESMRKGLTLFEEAVALDPNYAPAWIGIADSWCLLSEYGTGLAHEAYPKAKAAALRALELDERLPEAHTALALIKNYYDWDWAGAEASFRRALELNPNHATTHQWYAEFLAARGRFPEALKQIDRAQELAPDSLIIQSVEAWILYFVRDYDRAIAQCQRVIERAPNFAEIYSYLGRSYEMQGKFREAMDAFQKSSEIMKENTQRASALRTAAIRDAADYWRRRGELEEVTGNGALFETAEALTQQGETDRALTLLEQACEQRSTHVPYLDVFPTLDPLRPHPRFKALLQRAQLATK